MTLQLSLFKGKRQRGRRPPPALEFATHCMVADALRIGIAPGWLWSHFPAGEKRDKATAGRLKRMGLQPGWPDFLLISPDGRLHLLELKRGNAPLNDAQEQFRDACLSRNVPHAVARSFDQAVGFLVGWRALRVRL